MRLAHTTRGAMTIQEEPQAARRLLPGQSHRDRSKGQVGCWHAKPLRQTNRLTPAFIAVLSWSATDTAPSFSSFSMKHTPGSTRKVSMGSRSGASLRKSRVTAPQAATCCPVVALRLEPSSKNCVHAPCAVRGGFCIALPRIGRRREQLHGRHRNSIHSMWRSVCVSKRMWNEPDQGPQLAQTIPQPPQRPACCCAAPPLTAHPRQRTAQGRPPSRS